MKASRSLIRFLPPIGLFLFGVATVYYSLLCIDPGHDWGDDFALYIHQAQCFAHGESLQALLDWNRISNAETPLGPDLYPCGFPFLLSPVYAMFGLDFVALKVFCSLFFWASLPLLYAYFQQLGGSAWRSLVAAGFIGLNIHFLTFSNQVLSDFPFLFAVVLSLYLIKTARTPRAHVGLGIALFSAYWIRDAGLLLVPTLAAEQMGRYRREPGGSRRFWLPYTVFGLLALGVHGVLPQGGARHWARLFEGFDGKILADNGPYYTQLLSEAFRFDWEFSHGLFIVGAFVFGLAVRGRPQPGLLTFIGLYALLLLFWPHHQGQRFLFPLHPWVVWFVSEGLVFVERRLQLPEGWAVATLVLIGIPYVQKSLSWTRGVALEDSNAVYSEELQQIYRYVQEQLPEDAIVGFVKPRALHLFSGVRSVYLEDPQRLSTSLAEYALIDGTLDLADCGCTLVQSFEHWELVQKHPIQP
ncbi:phospholipid carrier-dependent glycosyltransferase [bacterium]|nr:phospholipid carrier-dependent glycosyltransferase [bacterium]